MPLVNVVEVLAAKIGLCHGYGTVFHRDLFVRTARHTYGVSNSPDELIPRTPPSANSSGGFPFLFFRVMMVTSRKER